jgi:hypothetical protein
MTFRLQEAELLFYFWMYYFVGPKPYSTYNFGFLSLPFLEESDLE